MARKEIDFNKFKSEINTHLEKMYKENEHLFVVELDKDELYNLYLDLFPPEDNKIFRVRRTFDCSSCRNFIKGIGNVVSINDGKVESIWDFTPKDSRLATVTSNLSTFVKNHRISDIFLSKFPSIGNDKTYEDDEENNIVRTWNHFYTRLPDRFYHNKRYETIDTARGQYRDIHNVFKRSLDELTMDAVLTVLDLVNQGSLYRGEEYKNNILSFKALKDEYDKLDDAQKELYAWEKSVTTTAAVAKIRNTAIGTLLIDVSENVDLEEAVRKYESVTAPSNYKRSKPIFTKQMLEDAQKTITELGYFDSLERRYANADDITVNNVLFSNKDTSKRIKGASSLFDQLKKDVKNSPKKFDRVEEVQIDKFIKDILPTTTEVEAYVEAKHMSNFVSLIAPVNANAKTMFKWNNNFSWAYTGNVTDSMVKQNVKKAGGKVDGVLRFSIQWNDFGDYDRNDLDAHCIEPSGYEIFFGTAKKPYWSPYNGQLDVDIINPIKDQPAVENITWGDIRSMKNGTYKFFVHCYTGRGGRSGFRAEIEFDGQIYSFDYANPLRDNQRVEVAEVTLKDGKFSIIEKLPSNCSSREVWGVKTNNFVPVSVICYSPNYWDEQSGIGNKHYFFMLKNCVNPELPNAWYSEFLNEDLYPKHRKVMEALSSKAHVLETNDQLSGIGFSSTLRNDLVVKVKGATERVLRIKF